MSCAFCASTAESTKPVRMIVSLTAWTWMSVLGIAVRRIDGEVADVAGIDDEFERRDALARWLSRAKIVVWPLATASTNILRAERTTALATCGLPMKISGGVRLAGRRCSTGPTPRVSLRSGASDGDVHVGRGGNGRLVGDHRDPRRSRWPRMGRGAASEQQSRQNHQAGRSQGAPRGRHRQGGVSHRVNPSLAKPKRTTVTSLSSLAGRTSGCPGSASCRLRRVSESWPTRWARMIVSA